VEIGADELRALIEPYARVVADVGTGDGRLPYALAREDPSAFFVGIDATRENLREMSHRASRKPARGGLPNVAYVVADAERPPPELHGTAHEVHVVLPWGRLMVGLLLAEPVVLGGLARLARPGADLHVILNGEVWSDPVPVDARDLPEPTVAYVEDVLAPAYAERAGIAIEGVRDMPPDAAHAIPSTWAKKLRHGRPAPRFVEFSGRFGSGAAPRAAPPRVSLRDITDTDFPTLFEHQADRRSTAMAAFPARDREAFEHHLRRILADPTITVKAVVAGGELVGNVLSFTVAGHPQVGYWIGREHWGLGYATAALRELIDSHVTQRPLHARAATHNAGSLRVLEKCGFVVVGSEHNGEVEEVVMRLDA
jgi:16S rRNA (adenine(1408)-N(1))-methyltransferase